VSEILEAISKMVYYFTSNIVEPAAFVYVGKDKVESTSTAPKPSRHFQSLTGLEMRT
jgi:hypothetical protein